MLIEQLFLLNLQNVEAGDFQRS